MQSEKESKQKISAFSAVYVSPTHEEPPVTPSPGCRPDRDATGLILPRLQLRQKRANVIGRMVCRLRYERQWSQEILAARLQLQGFEISRDVIANIECGRSIATDRHL